MLKEACLACTSRFTHFETNNDEYNSHVMVFVELGG